MLLRAEFQGFKGFFGHVPLWERGLSGYEIDLLARVIGARLLGSFLWKNCTLACKLRDIINGPLVSRKRIYRSSGV